MTGILEASAARLDGLCCVCVQAHQVGSVAVLPGVTSELMA